MLRGVHDASVVIDRRRKIHISGCGEQTIVRTSEKNNDPIFLIKHSQSIKLDNMVMVALEGTAIEIDDSNPRADSSALITIKDNKILAFLHAIYIYLEDYKPGDNNIEIIHNMIGMYDKPGGLAAIFTLADDVLIERNRIVLIPAPDQGDDDDPQRPPPRDPFDCCFNLKKIYAVISKFHQIVNDSIKYVTGYLLGKSIVNQAMGGIQVGGSSERVYIILNEIIGGKGNGILLGHDYIEKHQKKSSNFLYEIEIVRNRIQYMALSGIASLFHPEKENIRNVTHIEGLLIDGNNIKYCIQYEPRSFLKQVVQTDLPVAGICLASCNDCTIVENRIELNGKTQLMPVCGIFILIVDKLDISNNRVLNNGPDEFLRETKPNTRVRGGIVVWFAVKTSRVTELVVQEENFNHGVVFQPKLRTYDADPIAKIHDNIVNQPVGHALFMLALGPVSAVSNQFTSQGIIKKERFSTLAGCVFMMNLGISKDLLLIAILAINNWKYINPIVLGAGFSSQNNSAGAAFINFMNYPDGKIMFTSNQSMLDLRSTDSDFCLSSQLIFSLDDISFVNNQSECAGFVRRGNMHGSPASVDFVFFNTCLLGMSVRSNDNRFTDGFAFVLYSLLSMGMLNAVVNNQATHCIVAPLWIYRIKNFNIELQGDTCKIIELELQLNRH